MARFTRVLVILWASSLMLSCESSFVKNKLRAKSSVFGASRNLLKQLPVYGVPPQVVGVSPQLGVAQQMAVPQQMVVPQRMAVPSQVVAPLQQAVVAPQQMVATPQQLLATPPEQQPQSGLHPGAADQLDSATKEMKNAVKENKFFQLGSKSAALRQLAIAHPELLDGIGIVVVNADAYEQGNKGNSDKGKEDLKKGNPAAPCAECQHQEEKAAAQEYNDMMDASNQKQLENVMTPQEKMEYENQRKQQLKHEIAVEKQILENASKESRAIAKTKQQ